MLTVKVTDLVTKVSRTFEMPTSSTSDECPDLQVLQTDPFEMYVWVCHRQDSDEEWDSAPGSDWVIHYWTVKGNS